MDTTDADERGKRILGAFVLRNEFADAEVRLIQTHSGTYLEVTALRSGHSLRLDAFAVELLAEIEPATMSQLVQGRYDRHQPAADDAGR